MDYARLVRRAVLTRLKADPGVLALIPKASIYPTTVPANPSFPFARYGAVSTTPFRLSGLNSSATRFSVHAFTGSVKNDTGQVTETAEDRAGKIAEAIMTALDGYVLPLDGGMHATIAWLDSPVGIDGDEPGAWHVIVNCIAQVAA